MTELGSVLFLIIATNNGVDSMAFAPDSVSFDRGDGSAIGSFFERDHGNLFEFSKNHELVFGEDFPHKVWVTDPAAGTEACFRNARVLKTRAHIVVDEDADGAPVVETWHFKQKSLWIFMPPRENIWAQDR